MKNNTMHVTTQPRHAGAELRKRTPSYSVAPLLCVSSMLLILSGCTMAPSYTRPDAPVAAAWPSGPAYTAQAAQADQKPVAEIPWREFFIEPRLQQVLALAINNNRDLRVAALTIDKTRAQYQIQRADLLPQIDATAGAAIQRLPADLSASGQARINRQYSVGLGVSSYELDLFGRVRSLKDQALEQYLATEQAQRAVQISLVAEVANVWLALAADRERLKLAQDTLKSQQESLQLIQHRFDAGASSQLDLRQAQTRVEAARVDSALYTAQLAQTENALTLLVGTPVPAELLPSELSSVTALQPLPAGLPSEVLLQRPDILAAEHRLKSANANIGAARANFFPRIGLSASFGTASASSERPVPARLNRLEFHAPGQCAAVRHRRQPGPAGCLHGRARHRRSPVRKNDPDRLPRGGRQPGQQRHPGGTADGPAGPDRGHRRQLPSVRGPLQQRGRQLPDRAGLPAFHL